MEAARLPTPSALAAHEAHRAADLLMVVIEQLHSESAAERHRDPFAGTGIADSRQLQDPARPACSCCI